MASDSLVLGFDFDVNFRILRWFSVKSPTAFWNKEKTTDETTHKAVNDLKRHSCKLSIEG